MLKATEINKNVLVVCVCFCVRVYICIGNLEAVILKHQWAHLIIIFQHQSPIKGTKAPWFVVDSKVKAQKIQDEMSLEYLVVPENKKWQKEEEEWREGRREGGREGERREGGGKAWKK